MRKKWNQKWMLFSDKHPRLAKWIYQFFYFWVFSMGVTIFQYMVFTIMPYILGEKLAAIEFMWPAIPMHIWGIDYKWNILGYEVARNAEKTVVIGGGLGYFISYEVGTFLAQCINFPLQRNITFKSHGKISRQIFWYVVAWVLISLVCNGVNGLWIPIAQHYVSPAVFNLLVTFITGGVSMVIYFFVYKIIFLEDKQ